MTKYAHTPAHTLAHTLAHTPAHTLGDCNYSTASFYRFTSFMYTMLDHFHHCTLGPH